MKILSIHEPIGGKGGVESVSLRLRNRIDSQSHQYATALLGPSLLDRTWESSLGSLYVGPMATTLTWKTAIANFISLVWFLHRVLRTSEPDIIIVSWAPLMVLLETARKWTAAGRVPVIVYERGWYSQVKRGSAVFQYAYFWGLRRADHVICGAEDYAKALRSDLGVLADSVGIPLDLPVEPIARPESICHILFVGRMENAQKRVDRLLRACSRLPRTVPWHLQLVGDGVDFEALQSLSKDLGIFDQCTWSGWNNDPWSVVDTASLLAFPSDYEGFGAVMVEAMARGLPVLATNCPYGPANVIQNGMNGWLVPLDDEAFAQQLTRLVMGMDPLPPRQQVVDSVKRFDAEKVAERFLSICQQIYEGH